MERVIINATECGTVILPDTPNENVWMSEQELVELFGATTPNNSQISHSVMAIESMSVGRAILPCPSIVMMFLSPFIGIRY